MRLYRFAMISLATIGVCVFVRLLRWAHFLIFGGLMKKVDKLGRIVIPLQLRKKYGLTEGASIEFKDSQEGILLKSSEPLCKICHGKITDASQLPLCEACLSKAAKDYMKNKDK